MEKVYVQVYSVGAEPESMPEKLERLASIGYSGVEFAGYGGLDAKEMKKALANTGLECVSSHIGLNNIQQELEYLAEIGSKMAVCPCYHICNRDDALALAELLNKCGEQGAKYGIRVGYHNHTYEFWQDGGQYLLDYVIQNIDPKYAGFQLDCGWASASGVIPQDYINQYPGRLMSIHVKENNAVIGPENPNPDPNAVPLTDEERAAAIAENPDYGELICRCEKVTKAEILQAIHNPLGVHTLVGIKYRTRAMMGRCQGGYCQMRVAEMIEKELGIPKTELQYARKGSYLFTGDVREEV